MILTIYGKEKLLFYEGSWIIKHPIATMKSSLVFSKKKKKRVKKTSNNAYVSCDMLQWGLSHTLLMEIQIQM